MGIKERREGGERRHLHRMWRRAELTQKENEAYTNPFRTDELQKANPKGKWHLKRIGERDHGKGEG